MLIGASIDLADVAAACVDRPAGTRFELTTEHRAEFDRRVRGKVVLVTGAAGFIAQATLPHLLAARPRRLILLDSSENGLAALARRLVTTRDADDTTDVRMVLADITSPLLHHAVTQFGTPELVLHFAAVKHVRSERDVASALRIFDVNVAGTDRLLHVLADLPTPPPVFAVSTDKAARPTSMMGASKRLMESLLWAYPGGSSSARFANVLFSSGSITESWVDRLRRMDPISAPLETFRYFVTPAEAGLICANAVTAPAGSIIIPTPTAVRPTDLVELAERFLAYHDRRAVRITLEEWERDPSQALDLVRSGSEYPIVCTPRDTSGEKEIEEFVDDGERTERWSDDLSLIVTTPRHDADAFLQQLESLIMSSSTVDLDAIRTVLGSAVPTFHGSPNSATLDSRI